MSEAEILTDLGVFRSAARLFKSTRGLMSTPGREFRPTQVEALSSGKLSRREVQILQESQAKIRAALEKMPGGVPRSVSDLKTVLPHINPLGYTKNCTECGMAVDDVLAGRPVVAGNSRHTNILPGRLGGGSELKAAYTPASIEHELLQAGDGSRGVVIMGADDGHGHTANVVNLGGKTYWVDGQLSGLASSEKGNPIPVIFPSYPYDALNQNFVAHAFIRTDGGKL
jgi:hypothetical protein